jgi:hypothetical protein
MGGIGTALIAVLAGGAAAAAIYGGLAFVPSSAGLTTNTQAALGAGIGIAGGLVVGMLGAPEIGAAVAAGGVGAAAAQFASAEVASYQAGNPVQPAQPQPSASGINGINSLSEMLPVHSQADLQGAAMRLRSVKWR